MPPLEFTPLSLVITFEMKYPINWGCDPVSGNIYCHPWRMFDSFTFKIGISPTQRWWSHNQGRNAFLVEENSMHLQWVSAMAPYCLLFILVQVSTNIDWLLGRLAPALSQEKVARSLLRGRREECGIITTITISALNEQSWSFHNHGEGPFNVIYFQNIE